MIYYKLYNLILRGDRKVKKFALTHWMKIFFVFALTQNFCGNTTKNQKYFFYFQTYKFAKKS